MHAIHAAAPVSTVGRAGASSLQYALCCLHFPTQHNKISHRCTTCCVAADTLPLAQDQSLTWLSTHFLKQRHPLVAAMAAHVGPAGEGACMAFAVLR